MSLLRAIVHGFGFTLGAKAAEEALDEADKALSAKEAPLDLKALEKEGATAAKARAKAEAKTAREVDRELAAMKKRLKKS